MNYVWTSSAKSDKTHRFTREMNSHKTSITEKNGSTVYKLVVYEKSSNVFV